MFCPKCHDEYQDGFDVCAECKVPLVNSKPNFEPQTEQPTEFYVTDDTPALLCTAKNHMEADMIEATMKCHDIPILKKIRDGGDITMLYMGVSFTDTDIYVPSKLINCAKVLLEREPADFNDSECEKEFDTHKQEYAEKQRGKAIQLRWFFFIILGIPAIIALFALLRYAIDFLHN